MAMHVYTEPRSFRLRRELEHAEKGEETKNEHTGFVSYGLDDQALSATGFYGGNTYNNQLSEWNATIIGPQNTNLGDRFYMVRVYCGPSYPKTPPDIFFKTKINMQGVDQKSGRYICKLDWGGRHNTMWDVLCETRKNMKAASKLQQPPPESTY